MFPHRFFAARYFAQRYFSESDATAPAVDPTVHVAGMILNFGTILGRR